MTAYKIFTTLILACLVIVTVKADSEVDVHRRVAGKLSALDAQSLGDVKEFAKQADIEIRFSKHDYVAALLITIKELDPKGVKKLLNKWTGYEKAFKKLMDRIRVSCSNFLNVIDPAVEQYLDEYSDRPQMSPLEELMTWHFYKEHCQYIVDRWDDMIYLSLGRHKFFFEDIKPSKSKSSFFRDDADDYSTFSQWGG